MFIETNNLELININQYQSISLEGDDPGEGRLVLIAQDGSKRVIAKFAEFAEAYNLFLHIRDAIASGETCFSLESYQ